MNMPSRYLRSTVLQRSLTRRYNDPELLQHTEIIHAYPYLRDHSIRNAEHLYPLDHDTISRGRDPQKISLVRAVGSPYLCHLVSFSDREVGRDVQVRESDEVSLTESFILIGILIPIGKVHY